MTVDEFFEGYKHSRQLFEVVVGEVNKLGSAEVRVTKSQIAFHRRKAFAWVWIPGKYLHAKAAPLVLTFSFSKPDPSPRWKQITKISPARYTHHLELHSVEEIDQEVRGWLAEAWTAAG
jgi:hypothetical protein